MAKKNKLKKTVVGIVITILSIVLLVGLSGLAVYNFVIIPKYNQYISSGEKSGEKLTNKDIILFAKYLTDKQLITNLVNIDKQTAKDVLSTMLEIEEEIEPTEETEQTPAPILPPVFSQLEKVIMPTPAPTPSPTPYIPPEIPKEVEVSKEQKTAYDRIMATAKKEEISAGLAIISKIDISKVVKLNREGRRAELKAYIKSVLTSKEISQSLALYRKYKHLL